MYSLCAAVTLLSAALGAVFSIVFAVRGRGGERTNALYMAARAAALFGLALVPFFVRSVPLLAAVTGAMLVTQLLDGILGVLLRRPANAAGPFFLAALHGACLVFLLYP